MGITQRNEFVRMERDTLEEIPCHPLPSGFSAKWYEPGDEQLWIDVHLKAEKYQESKEAVYVGEFGTDTETLRRRQLFLLDDRGNPVDTATAWFDDDYHGHRHGRVHWVAVVPEYQGRGLSKPLVSLVLARLVELGHDRAYLRTTTARLHAIYLYVKFGFVPSLRTPEDRFAAIDDFPYEPRYVDIDGLRMAYFDEGLGDAGTVLLPHGESTWGYL